MWPRQGGGGPTPPGQPSLGSPRYASKVADVSLLEALASYGSPSNRWVKVMVLLAVGAVAPASVRPASRAPPSARPVSAGQRTVRGPAVVGSQSPVIGFR